MIYSEIYSVNVSPEKGLIGSWIHRPGVKERYLGLRGEVKFCGVNERTHRNGIQ